MTLNDFTTALSVKLDTNYTEEQREFFQHFNEPTFAFASPGTGKTMSAVAGLLVTELYHRIPGQNIYAMSFTRAATGELKVRHKRACQALSSGVGASRVQQTVQFDTLSAFCKTIVEENYDVLGLDSKPATKSISFSTSITLVRDLCDTWNIAINPNKIRYVVNAIRNLNASLIFNEQNVEASYEFKLTGLSYEEFTRIRQAMLQYALNTCLMPVSDIFLYALTVFLHRPSVSEMLKKKIRVMLIDEAQDLSLLQLKLISYMTDCPVFIGDMKQQIYGFNGACAEIVDEFFKLFPNAHKRALSQSFRCKNEIADFATRIILPNTMGGEDFKGTGAGGTVQILENMDYKELAVKMHEGFENHTFNYTTDVMFLFRNNISMIPIIESLYQEHVPYRTDKYISVRELPVLHDLLEVIQLCRNPFDLNSLYALRFLLPEFQVYGNVSELSVYKIMSKQGGSIFDLNFQYKDSIAPRVFNTLIEVSEELRKRPLLKDVLNKVYPLYAEAYLKKNEWRLEQESSYYINIALPAITGKTYDEFVHDEIEKEKLNKEYTDANLGVRCYTMHTSKGLQADTVYIIDADAQVVPNESQIKKRVKAHCELDIAKMIRNERSLCYVACTRAKQNLYLISHNLSPMFLGDNEFRQYDAIYNCARSAESNEVQSFDEFIGGVTCAS